MISGYKTYFLAFIGIVWAMVGYLLGNLDSTTASEILWASLTAGALRNGISNSK